MGMVVWVLTRGRCAGMTLIEVLCVLALTGVSAAAAMSRFDAAIRAAHVRSAADALAWDLRSARAEAVLRGQRVSVCASADGVRCGGPWGLGWIVFEDASGRGQPEPGHGTLQTRGAWRGVHVQTAATVRAVVSYSAEGWPRQPQGALQMGHFVFCAGTGTGRRVVLSASGRVRVETGLESGACGFSAG